MRKTLATLAVAAVGALAGVGPATAPAHPIATASCVHVHTPGGTKCLQVGQFCSHKAGYAAAYRRAGFKCKANGHLAYR